MPWTLVHPAAVLPFKRPSFAPLPFDALVIGSMSPDFGYYVDAFKFAARAHTASGIALICLPSSLLLYALVRPLYAPVTALLPAPHRQALETLTPAPRYHVAGLLFACLAILIGAATHNVWDAFTHVNGVGVMLLPILRTNVASVAGHVFPACEVLQHASTLVGAALLLLAYRRWLRLRIARFKITPDAQDALRWGLLAVLVAVSILTAGFIQAATASEWYGHWGWMRDLVHFVILSTTVFAAILVAAALALRVAQSRGATR